MKLEGCDDDDLVQSTHKWLQEVRPLCVLLSGITLTLRAFNRRGFDSRMIVFGDSFGCFSSVSGE